MLAQFPSQPSVDHFGGGGGDIFGGALNTGEEMSRDGCPPPQKKHTVGDGSKRDQKGKNELGTDERERDTERRKAGEL